MPMIIPQDTMGKMATSGMVGMGICAAVDGMGSRVTIPRFDDARIPLYAASGLAAMAASGASSLAHNILIPALAEEDKWTEGTSTAVALLSAGAGVLVAHEGEKLGAISIFWGHATRSSPINWQSCSTVLVLTHLVHMWSPPSA